MITPDLQKKNYVISEIKSIRTPWLTVFFEYPQENRKVIYTTNAVEGYHRMVRKFTINPRLFFDLIRYPKYRLYERFQNFKEADYAGLRLRDWRKLSL